MGGADLMASIRRKGKHWQVVWAVYQEGRRQQLCRTFATNASAKQHRAKVEGFEQRGVGTVRTTLGDYLTEWLATKTRATEANTAAGYERWVGHILRGHVAKLPLDRVTPRDLEQLYQYLLDTPAGRGRPLSPASVRHCHALLQNALNDAVRDRQLDINPAAHAKPPHGQSQKVAVPSADQVGALLDDLAVNNPDLVDLALVIIATGLRRSEVLGLRFADVDWTGCITVRQVVIEHDGAWSIRQGTKSIAGQRTISLAPATLEALRRQQVRVAETRLQIGRFWQDQDLVFPAVGGTPRAPAAITKAFTRAAKRAGWPAHSSPVHSLRHAAASIALASGVDLATIARRLGHSSPAVTARIYLSSDTERDRAAATVMANIPRTKEVL
jgi:integrase